MTIFRTKYLFIRRGCVPGSKVILCILYGFSVYPYVQKGIFWISNLLCSTTGLRIRIRIICSDQILTFYLKKKDTVEVRLGMFLGLDSDPVSLYCRILILFFKLRVGSTN